VDLIPKATANGHANGFAVSPGLFQSPGSSPAFEVKFLLTETKAVEVEQRLRSRLSPDPHADAAGGYRVTSVYFDTPAWDVFHRSDKYRRRKYRVRRYGTSPTVFLERKSKKEQRVRKRRTALPLAELTGLSGEGPSDWPGAWFARQVTARGLRPVCRVSYHRLALVGTCADGPIRVTFDRTAHGGTANGPTPECVADGHSLLHSEVIVEFKFLASMPVLFKDVIDGLRLGPRPVSKYRRCVEAVGLATEGRNA
jgi:VTC domain